MLDYFQTLIANCSSKWRPVVGYEGLYEVSMDGEVRSIDRRVFHPRLKMQSIKGKALKQTPRNGYLSVQLSRDGSQGPHSVHCLVVAAHSGVIPDGMCVDHRNGDKMDNRLGNLRIATPAQNSRNRTASRNKHGHRGIMLCNNKNRAKKWRATIRLGDKRQHIGNFLTFDEAVSARLAAELKYWGSDAPSVVRS